MDYTVEYIRAETGNTHEQTEDICLKLSQYHGRQNVIKAVFFLPEHDDAGYQAMKEDLEEGLDSNEHAKMWPVSYLAQSSPERTIVAEVWSANDVRPEYCTHQGMDYVRMMYKGRKLIVSPGIAASQTNNPAMQIMEKQESLLQKEGMRAGNILRQWNYIPGITEASSTDQGQNYQLFNNERARYYNANHFPNGFPASTGIGVSCGPMALSFIAADIPETKALSNPDQIDAHKYSRKVLCQTICEEDESPRFERARALEYEDHILLFVSGTASIRGEETIGIDDISKQTSYTLANIEKLVAEENLIKHGIDPAGKKRQQLYMRVYCKSHIYYEQIKKEIEKKHMAANTVYVEAAVCRPELLVEIEAAYSYRN